MKGKRHAKVVELINKHNIETQEELAERLNEAGFNADVIEAALAHSDKNEVRRAYNRSTYLEQRIELMEWWGNKVKKNN